MVVSAVIVGAVATGYTIYSGEQQRKQQKKQLKEQKKANEEAKQRAEQAAERADIAMNKENRKTTNVSALQSKEEQAASVGGGGTLLTGSGGVDAENLNLGGNTLLGG
tara:strand:+ start:204 stop:527 length:324 start_codon:yes stop_codon:yes gene_type:complete